LNLTDRKERRERDWSLWGAGSNGKAYELTNIVGRFFASEERRVVLATK
jgi:hypothetical protein